MRRDYTPLQPLPDVQFEPTSSVFIRGGHGKSLEVEAEIYGQEAVILVYNQFGEPIDGEFVVLHLLSSVAFTVFRDLRVARAFAQEIDDLYDFDAIWNQWKTSGNDRTIREVTKTINERAYHPTNMNYHFQNSIFKD